MASENKSRRFSVATDPMTALRYFEAKQKESASLLDPAIFRTRGERVLAAQAATFLDPAAETAECDEFIAWSKATMSRKRSGKPVPNVKHVIAVVPPTVLPLPAGYKAELIDFSPAGGLDDLIYSKHHDVWVKLPRGTCILSITTPSGANRKWWGVRANRKFTGHEDEGSCDATQYTITRTRSGKEDEDSTEFAESKDASAADPVRVTLVTMKENGQVVHLAARSIEVDNFKMLVVFIGSKHVHLCVPWDIAAPPSRAHFVETIKSFQPAGRFELAQQMAEAMFDFISAELLTLLSSKRLVLNCEYVVPSGGGPIDNRLIHSIERGTPFAFSLVFNALHPVIGAELCLEPLYAYELLQNFGFQVVRHFLTPADQLKQIKTEVAKLPFIEGSVVYHLDDLGTVRLEKAKSIGYVIARAIREKSKPFLCGRKDSPGLIEGWTQAAEIMKSIAVEDKKANEWWIRVTHPDNEGAVVPVSVAHDLVREHVTRLGGAQVAKAVWRVKEFPQDATAQIREQFKAQALQLLLAKHAPPVEKGIAQRVKDIDHMPMTPEEREYWTACGHAFVRWIAGKVVEKSMSSSDVFDHFSSLWGEFYAGYIKPRT